MAKYQILEKLHVESAISVIVTLDNLEKKRLVCESVLHYYPEVKVVVKVISLEEKEALIDLPIAVAVDGKKEVASRLVGEAMQCRL
jgi:CPA2 family monovalent cation:H+ antiporter-2